MEEAKVKRRGKGKVPALVHVNVRLPEEVLNFYKRYSNYTGQMREVLIAFKEKSEAQNPDT